MNVFLREVASYRKSTIIWIVSLSVGVFVFLTGMYPTFTQDIEASKELISQLPEALRRAFSIQLSTFFTIYGFYAYLLNFVGVAGAVQAMNLGTGVIAKENAGKTADFLLSKPIARHRIMSSKLAAALFWTLATSVVFGGMSLLAAAIATEGDFDAGNFALMTSTFFLLQLFFVALGALFAVIIPKIKSVISVTLPTVFALYIVGTLGDVLGNEEVRYLTPFKFFDPMYMASKGQIEGRYLALELALVAIALVATYVIYLRSDVRAPA